MQHPHFCRWHCLRSLVPLWVAAPGIGPNWPRSACPLKFVYRFCPVGPAVTDEIDPWAGIGVKTTVSGEVRQDGNTRDFIFPLDVVIRYISQVMTLLPGDLVATGTPKGVGPVVAGDVIEVTIDGIGNLQNPVADE